MDYIRIYKTEVPNAKRTLDSPVLLSAIYEQIENNKLKEYFYRILPYHSLYFWDFGVKAAKELEINMLVSIICGTKKYDCQIIEIFEDPKGELGDKFGWAKQYHAPWKNVCALDVLNMEYIESNKISEIKSKTTPVTDTLLKVIDVKLKNQEFLEGKNYDIVLTKYERNQAARRACIAHYGPSCRVCNFDFYSVYGELGKGYIHVHHIISLSEIGEQYTVDPINDLIPLCANCHYMIHRKKPALSIDELKLLLQNRK